MQQTEIGRHDFTTSLCEKMELLFINSFSFAAVSVWNLPTPLLFVDKIPVYNNAVCTNPKLSTPGGPESIYSEKYVDQSSTANQMYGVEEKIQSLERSLKYHC